MTDRIELPWATASERPASWGIPPLPGDSVLKDQVAEYRRIDYHGADDFCVYGYHQDVHCAGSTMRGENWSAATREQVEAEFAESERLLAEGKYGRVMFCMLCVTRRVEARSTSRPGSDAGRGSREDRQYKVERTPCPKCFTVPSVTGECMCS